MSLKILIGGGTGFIGKRLTNILTSNGYDVTVVSRMPALKRMTWHDLDNVGMPKGTVAVVNLAGQNVLDPSRRWTPGFKQNVWNSRINTTSAIVRAITKSENPPKVFVNISGVNLYRPDNVQHTEEETGSEYDFMSKLCLEWEKSASIPSDINTRSVKIRTGVVIGKEGGMIQNLKLPFQLGLGGHIGKGTQPMPWIHIIDLCYLIKYAIEEDKVRGVLNGVAPEIVTNSEFTKAFASALRRPALFPVPETVFNFIMNPERAVLITTGAKVVPKRTLELGFKYNYPTIKSACKEVA